MKKSVIAIVVLIIVVVGGILIFHKSPKPKSSSSTQSISNNAPAINNAVLITKTNSTVGQYLANPSGMALYTYGSDSNGVSNCTGSCLQAWPAYVDKGSTTNLPSGV